MGMVFGIIGILGFIVFLIGLIVVAIQRKPKKPYLIGLAVCFVLFIVGVALPSNNTQDKIVQAKSPSSSVPSKALNKSSVPEDNTMEINYKTLYKEYNDNPIKADSKYKDKKIQLTGTIADIDRDIGQNPYITFNVDEYGTQSIKMSFDDDKPVESLKKGQRVTIVGTCGGTFASTIVVLNDCTVVK